MNITSRDRYIMDFLRRQAIEAEKVANAKFAAAVGIKGKIISLGFASNKTHPFAAKYGKNADSLYLHAETSAIVNSLTHIGRDGFSKATLYIYRVKRPNAHSDEWVDGMAKPCLGCAKAIAEFDFKKVIYTTNNNGEYETL